MFTVHDDFFIVDGVVWSKLFDDFICQKSVRKLWCVKNLIKVIFTERGINYLVVFDSVAF